MTERNAEERFVENQRKMWEALTEYHSLGYNITHAKWMIGAVHAFADVVCAGRARYGMFAEGGEAACRVRASQRLNGDILDGRRNPGDPLDFESEQEKEHATCRANLLKRVMGGE